MNILRAPEAADKLGFSVPTLWRKAKAEADFPKPVKVSAKVTGWLAGELDAWLAQRVAESRKVLS